MFVGADLTASISIIALGVLVFESRIPQVNLLVSYFQFCAPWYLFLSITNETSNKNNYLFRLAFFTIIEWYGVRLIQMLRTLANEYTLTLNK